MEILWHGHSFFEIKTLSEKEKVKIAIDPYSEKIGLKPPKIEADFLLISHHHYDHDNKEVILGDYFLIEKPGEYEKKGIFIKAIPSFHDEKEGKERGENLIFLIESEEIKVCHLGDLGQKELTEEQLEKLNGIDVLMIPVGGIFTISAKEAIKIIEQIEPKIVIPMHYYLPNLKIKLNKVEDFLKILGIKLPKREKKLQIKKENFFSEKQEVIILEPK